MVDLNCFRLYTVFCDSYKGILVQDKQKINHKLQFLLKYHVEKITTTCYVLFYLCCMPAVNKKREL